MAYSIWPRETDRVFTETGRERDDLRSTLLSLHPPIARAEQGAGPATVGALSEFGTAQAKASAEAVDRIDTALANGDLAVAAYVRGDEEMAAEYGRASVVFAGPLPGPPPPGGPLPETVSGG